MLLIFNGSSGMVVVNAIAGGSRSPRKKNYGPLWSRRHALRGALGAASFEFGVVQRRVLRQWLRSPMLIAVEAVGCDAERFCARRACVPALILGLALGGCAVGPDYVPEAAPVSKTFKELKGWRLATPSDALNRGDWWAFYRDPKLAFLIKQVEISNQTVAAQAAAYEQARALIREAQAALFPVLSATYNATRAYNGPGTGGAGVDRDRRDEGRIFVDLRSAAFRDLGSRCLGQGAATNREQLFRGTGQLRRPRQCKLSAQAQLATAYFNLRAADALHDLLDRTVAEYKKTLDIVQNQFKAGYSVTAADVATAEAQVFTTEARPSTSACSARNSSMPSPYWSAARPPNCRSGRIRSAAAFREFRSRFRRRCSSGVPTSPLRNEPCRSKTR